MDQPIHEEAPIKEPRENPPSWFSLWAISHPAKVGFAIGFFVVFLIAVFIFALIPPPDFPLGEKIAVENGSSLGQVSISLKQHHVIRSRLVFEFCMISMRGDRSVVAGDYLFKEPLSACSIASRIARGISGVPAVKVTIPEGMSNAHIAEILSRTLIKFDAALFLIDAHPLEGYLFPETYFFHSQATAADVQGIMNAQFKKKIDPLRSAIEKSGHALSDIIIMASILEKEAKTPEDQALVSGILWGRIARGMPLQVDAPFYYLLGKESRDLTQADLALKSGYNTYKNKGLPPGAIGNPGMGAIRAAIFPVLSSYVYYLSGKDGTMHYAKTFDEHKMNKVKYLQ